MFFSTVSRINSADPAIREGFNRIFSPFRSRYTLKPRLCSSPPLFHDSNVPLELGVAVNEFRRTEFGNSMVLVNVAVLLVKSGSVVSVVTAAVLTAREG